MPLDDDRTGSVCPKQDRTDLAGNVDLQCILRKYKSELIALDGGLKRHPKSGEVQLARRAFRYLGDQRQSDDDFQSTDFLGF